MLRSELLKDVTLPAGMRGWRILYTTTVDDRTPATAVATVLVPSGPPAGPRPVITWEHGTTGVLPTNMAHILAMNGAAERPKGQSNALRAGETRL